MIKDVRIGCLVAVPAAVALLSLIWFLRRKPGDKKSDRQGGTRGDTGKSPHSVADHDLPEKPVPAGLLDQEDKGITLTQRKIPDALDYGQGDCAQLNSNTCSSSVPVSEVAITSTEASLTSSQKQKVDEIVQSALDAGLREAQGQNGSDSDKLVEETTYKDSIDASEVSENLVQENMIITASAPLCQNSPQPVPKVCSDEVNQNYNCSQTPSLCTSISISPSKTNTQDTKGANQSSDCGWDSSCLNMDSSNLVLNSSPSAHSQHLDEQSSLSCDDSRGLSHPASIQDVAVPADLCKSRSGQRESSSDSAISPSTSLRNSFSDEQKELGSEGSWVEIESDRNTDLSGIPSVGGSLPDSTVEETMEKAVMASVQLPIGDGQHSDEPSANSVSPVCDNNSVGSNDSGRGGSEQDTAIQANENLIHFEFNMPSELCGRLIGRQGKNINFIKSRSGASVSLTNNPFTPEFQICQVIGSQSEVDEALSLIRKKFPLPSNPRLTMAPLNLPAASQIEAQAQSIVVPEGVQLSLPEGVSVDVYVSAIVNAGHVFVQQPTHRTFMSLEKLNFFLNSVYGQDPTIPCVPEPVECGVICICENEGSWYRTMITSPVEDNGECQVKFVDYGGYAHLPVSSLKQIRTDFMSLPFQAVECFMANMSPQTGENFFSDLATLSLSERTQLKLLKCQVVARSEEGTPFIHLYDIDHEANAAVMLNRSMAEDGLVRWVEIL